MSKLQKWAFLLCFLFFGLRSSAQEITVGTGNQIGFGPFIPYLSASYIQSIYLSSELTAGEITSISYHYAASETLTATPVTIYMGEVTNASFTSTEDRIPLSSLTEVFSGSLTFSSGWITINLTSPFQYNGTGNLVVAFLNNAGQSLSWDENHFYCTTTTGNMTNIYGVWGGTINVSNIAPSWTDVNYEWDTRPNTKFNFSASGGNVCPRPENVNLSEITDNSATLSWTTPEGETTFGVSMKLASDTDWTFLSNVTGNSYILSNLQGLTDYQAKVWTICSEDSLSSEVVKSFSTSVSSSQISTLPYTETFDEQSSISTWLIENGTATNKWFWGTAENNTAEVPTGGALFISSNNGLSNLYDNTATSEVYATKYFNFPEALNFKLAFDVKGLGESGYDELSVYLAKGGEDLSESNLIGTYSEIDSWERQTAILDSTYSNQSVRLVFKWENDHSLGSNIPAAVDNISLETLPCGLINNLMISYSENNNSPVALVTIDDPNANASSYLVEYRISGAGEWTVITTNAPVFDILGLSYATTYDVRVKVLCGENESEVSPIYNFTTPCGIISEFPWAEGFEQEFISDSIGNKEAPLCWTQISNHATYKWVRNEVYPNTGEGCLRGNMTNYSMTNLPKSWMISPSMAFTGSEKLTFKLKKQYASHVLRLKVYVLDESEQIFSQISDTSRFELLRTIEYNEPTNEYSNFEVGLTSLSSRGRFAFVFDTLSHPIFIDDVMVDELPACPDVYGVTATKLSTSSVAINFDTTNSNGSGWLIAYGQATSAEEFNPINTPSSQQITITSSSQLPYVIDSLGAGTYYFSVQQNCDGPFSSPVTAFFPIVNNLPYAQNFNTNSVPEWDLSNHTGNNVWYVDSCMFISNNNGDSNTYDFSSQSKSYAITYISFPSAPSFTIAYDWKAMGQQQYNSAYDYGKVYLLPDTMEIPTNYLINNYAISENLYLQNTWQTDTIELDATYANKVWKLIFMWQNNNNTGNNPPLSIDNISVVANACGQVIDLNVEYSQTSEGLVANLSFTDYTLAPSYIIEYKAEDETEWTVVASTTVPYQITGLQFNTEYLFRVAVECEDGTITPYTTITSQSPCQAITQIPWEESFNVTPNECWLFRKGALTDTTYTNDLQIPGQYEMPWQFNTTNPIGGVIDGRMQAYLYGITARYWLITPTIEIPSQGIYELSVDVLARSSSLDQAPQSAPDDKFVILVSTDNGISWTISNAQIYTDSDSDTVHNFSQFNQTPTRVKFKLQDSEGEIYSGQLKFAFYVESTVSNGSNFFYIDNIAINEWSDCTIPTNLSITNITNNTVQLTFNQEEGVEGWEYIAVPEGASIESAIPVEVAESPVIIENLEAEMNYTVYLRTICSETSVSPWSIGISFLTTPDPTTIPYTCNFEFAEGEATGWLLKNGTCANQWAINGQLFVTADGTTPGYGTGTSVILAEKLFLFGESDSITISFDLTIGGEMATGMPFDYLKLFLLPENENLEPTSVAQIPEFAHADYSQNVILTNAEGGYYVNMITSPTTINITIPTPQEPRKLVFAWINDNSMGTQPGAIIDNFSIVETTESESPCFAPANLVLENSIDTVNISWTPTANENQWEVRLDETDPIIIYTPSHLFTNLSIGQHTIYVRAICSEETYSEWASITFDFSIIEPIVTTGEATNITDNSAILNANVQLGNQTITIAGFKYKLTTTEEWITETISNDNAFETLTLEINNLLPATEYEYKAFVLCGETEYEGETETFSTLSSLQDELNNTLSVNLYPNPAKHSTTIELLGMNSGATISIVNMQGQLLKTIEIEPTKTYELDLTNFASGVYYVKIITEGKIITQKLIIE